MKNVILCSKIRWYGMFLTAMLVLFFTLPMVFFGVISLWAFSLQRLALALFMIPLGLMPAHILLVNYVSVCFTETGIIMKKYGGLWKKQYAGGDLVAVSSGSYRPYKGSRKIYRTVTALFEDGRIYVVDEGNCTNYFEIKDALYAANPLVDTQRPVYSSLAWKLWLTYALIAIIGGMGMAFIIKYAGGK